MLDIEDKRDELVNDICLYIQSFNVSIDAEFKNMIYALINKYEITSRSTEIVPLNEDRNKELLRRFIIAKKVSGRTDKTLKYYKQTNERTLQYIGKTVDDITPDDIRKYIAIRLGKDKVAKTTISSEIRNLSSLFQWLQSEEIVLKNPMLKVDMIKQPKQKKEALTDIEIEKLRSVIKNERDKMIFEVLLSTGCRVSEFCQILLTDIEGNRVLVHGKGQKDRYCYLNAKAMLSMEIYMSLRKDHNPYLNPKGGLLKMSTICRDKGNWWKNPQNITEGYISNSSIESIMRRLAKRAGVDQANPHKLRRTCATMALRHGMPVEQVSKMLGHSDIATTQIYLDLSEEDLAIAHKKYVV